MMNLISTIKSNPKLKSFALWCLQPPMRPRPRLWVQLFVNPFFHQRGKKSLVCNNTRLDVFPYNRFQLGNWSTIEDFSCVNNAMGDVIVGNYSRVGLRNTVIGPINIGDNVNIAQNVVLSGLNHGYEDITMAPRLQKCTTSCITISDDCWIGANAVITAGITIGKHSIVAAGSVVTKDVPPFSIVAGNPAKIKKQYNSELGKWVKVSVSNHLKCENYETEA